MSVSLPNGTLYAIATAYGAALNVTAATNAAEAVLTVTNTLAVGDYVEFISSWPKANLRIFRVKLATGTSVTLEGLDTTSTTLYAAGNGTGTIRKLMTWVPITQVLSCDSSGGEPKYVTYEFVEAESENEIPNGFSAQKLTMSIADDPTLPHHAALKTATESRKIAGLKATLPAGGLILYNGFPAFNETPSMTKGQVMAVSCGFALQGRPVRYAA